MARIINASDSTFQEVLDAHGAVLVDFWAPWCGPCRALSPVLDQVASEHPDTPVVKVNVDESPETANRYGVMSIPHLMLFRSGEKVAEVRGAAPKSMLKKLISA